MELTKDQINEQYKRLCEAYGHYEVEISKIKGAQSEVLKKIAVLHNEMVKFEAKEQEKAALKAELAAEEKNESK